MVVFMVVAQHKSPFASAALTRAESHVCLLSTRTTSISARVARSMSACGLQA